ncbi:MAG: OmpA family protein [Fibrobacterales bacterium]
MAIHLDKHDETPWIMFTDLTMALFVLFLIAFIFMSSLKSDKEAELTKQIDAFTRKEEEFQKEKAAKEKAERERDALLAQALGNSLRDGSVTLTDGKIEIQAEFLFSTGSSIVKKKGKDVLRKISDVLGSSLGKNEMLMVAGHTDDIPINSKFFKSNWELSTKRATNVVNILMKKSNTLVPSRIFAAGFGEFRPKVENSHESNRMKNRRVEIIRVPTIDSKIDG